MDSQVSQVSDRDFVSALTSPLKSERNDSKTRFNENVIIVPPTSRTSLQCSRLSTVTPVEEAIHYLSPASMSPLSERTVDEGDIYGIYKTPSFMQFLEHYEGRLEPTISSTVSCVEPELQRTLAIVKPDAMEYEDVIVRAIIESGFQIIQKRYLHLTPEQVSEIYAKHYGTAQFPHMVVSMSIGPILSLCIGTMNAVMKWKDLVGPRRVLRAEWFFPMSMRVRFGLQPAIPGAVHASDSYPEAKAENIYVNPESILEPILTDEPKVIDYLDMYVNPTLLGGLAEVVRAKPIDPIIHLAEWLLDNNPHQPRVTHEIAILPT